MGSSARRSLGYGTAAVAVRRVSESSATVRRVSEPPTPTMAAALERRLSRTFDGLVATALSNYSDHELGMPDGHSAPTWHRASEYK